MVIEKKFKSTLDLPDTIYVLTSIESNNCGYPYLPSFEQGALPDSYYQYIVYGDRWIEKTITKSKKGKRYVGQIKESLLKDTFFTSICRRTQNVNSDELRRLLALKL